MKDRRVVRVNLTSYERSPLVFERRHFRFNNLALILTADERENLIVSLQAVMRAFAELEKLYPYEPKNNNGAGLEAGNKLEKR